MISFSRLLDLAGCRPLLMEALSPRDAASIFQYYGANPAEFSDPDLLKKIYRRLMIANHPDKVGAEGTKAASEINAAYDVLKDKPQLGKASSSSSRNGSDKDDDDSWVMAGYSGGARPSSRIYRNNYSDLNFIKKTMWELSGKSRTVYTIWNFDGHYFRGCFSVYGSEKIFPEMALAMRTWEDFHKTRATFVQKKGSKDLLLIWANGKNINPPVPFEHDSFNNNPGNDQDFVRKLPGMLDQLENEAETSRTG